MKQNRLRLSLVIPAFNEEAQLYDCLLAVENQIDPADEVIVVNNNSLDCTAAVAAKFGFVSLINESRQGLRFARNAGMNAASGEIIGRIDADTRLKPDWTAQARQLFSADAELMAATGPVYYHDMPLPRLSLGGDDFIRAALNRWQGAPLLYGSNMVIRRIAWQAVLPKLCRAGEFFEDIDLSIHLSGNGCKIGYEPFLVAGVSARRMDDSPADFYNNLGFYQATFARHNQFSLAALGAKSVFLAIYPACKLIRQFYDPLTGKICWDGSAGRLKLQPRPTSNT
ncbi:MAG: glycosyltransferase family 2 protein [Candidatus Saccharimonadales bacterium]